MPRIELGTSCLPCKYYYLLSYISIIKRDTFFDECSTE